jgi:phage terminase large subunit-like protein
MDYYREWVFHKYLKTTPGNVTDYSYITREILDMEKICSIEDIFYDKYNAAQWVQECTDAGLNMTDFSQTIGNFNNATCEFERLILSGKVVMDDNPITRYCIRNVELRQDMNGNRKPLKNSDRKKIDGVIAMLQALAAWIKATSDYKGTQIF